MHGSLKIKPVMPVPSHSLQFSCIKRLIIPRRISSVRGLLAIAFAVRRADPERGAVLAVAFTNMGNTFVTTFTTAVFALTGAAENIIRSRHERTGNFILGMVSSRDFLKSDSKVTSVAQILWDTTGNAMTIKNKIAHSIRFVHNVAKLQCFRCDALKHKKDSHDSAFDTYPTVSMTDVTLTVPQYSGYLTCTSALGTNRICIIKINLLRRSIVARWHLNKISDTWPLRFSLPRLFYAVSSCVNIGYSGMTLKRTKGGGIDAGRRNPWNPDPNAKSTLGLRTYDQQKGTERKNRKLHVRKEKQL